jgi:hypothetical protein
VFFHSVEHAGESSRIPEQGAEAFADHLKIAVSLKQVMIQVVRDHRSKLGKTLPGASDELAFNHPERQGPEAQSNERDRSNEEWNPVVGT